MTAAPRHRPRLTVAWTAATWFGCGLAPKAPGTVGTLGAIPLYLLAAMGGQAGVAAAALAATAVGIWASSVVAGEVGLKDPQLVVIDEVAGFLVTMIPVAHASWRAVLLGFVLFRAMDILKPWPIRRLEALPGGWGIVMDDVAAGAIGAVAMAGLRVSGALA
jgi:phosphatidylglycerophosphatase A